MSLLSSLHQRLGVALIVVVAVAAVWAALSSHGRGLAALRAYVRCCEAALGAQVALGLVLVAVGRRPHNVLHWMYGALVLISLPLAAQLGERVAPSRERWLLAAGALAAGLFAVRAVTTGG